VRVTTQTGGASIGKYLPIWLMASDHSDPEILSEKVSAHRIKATLGITGL
jgi:hypothetical protein